MKLSKTLSGRVLALFASVSLVNAQAILLADAADMDFGSPARIAPAPMAGAVRVGNGTRIVQAGDMLTAAELAAMMQVASTGKQQLAVGANGIATGGRFNLNDITQGIGNLIIPSNVTVLQNFASGQAVNLTGILNNAGSLLAFSTNPLIMQGTFNAASILNQSGALISTRTALGVNSLDLILNAAGDIVNKGIIESAGGLSITSPNITNEGTIAAFGGNVNLNAPGTSNFVLNNIGGTIRAITGDINVRDTAFAAKADATILGGNLPARNININSGDGTVTVNANSLAGRLNINGGIAHVMVADGVLTLGDITLTGDPTFYNTGGDVVLSGNLQFIGQALAIVAAGDILNGSQSPISIATTSIAANAGDITLVAGAQFSSTGPAASFSADSTSTITITGGSTIGGKIDLAQGGGIAGIGAVSNNGNAGDINLIAFGGTNTGSGTITLSSSSTVIANATGGTAGTIKVIAGGDSTGNTIELGDVISQINTAGTPGSITISTRQPDVGSGITILDGAITSGAFTAGGALGDGSILLSDAATSAGAISIESSKNLIASGVTALALAGFAGAPLSISTNSSTQFGIGSNNGVNFVDNLNSSSAAGKGADITIQNSGSGGIFVNRSLGANGNNGDGGSILVDATANGGTGSVAIGSVSLLWAANGVGAGGNGGSITIRSTGAITSPGPVQLQARANTSGTGGTIAVEVQSATADILALGSGANNLIFSATGSQGGGTINLSAGRDIDINPNFVSAANMGTGNGANYMLEAGRNLFVRFFTLNADAGTSGNGGNVTLTAGNNLSVAAVSAASINGTGGTITLTSKSSAPFIVGNSSTNGLAGSVNVSGSQGGTVNIRAAGNGGVGIFNASGIIATGSNAGNINIDATFNGGTGPVIFNTLLTANGTAGNGGNIDIRADHFIINSGTTFLIQADANGPTGNGGSIALHSLSSNHDVNVGVSAPGLNLLTRGGTAGGDGGSITVESGRDIIGSVGGVGITTTFYAGPQAQGYGGHYVLKAGRNVSLNGGLNAAGIGIADGGSIEVESNSTFPLVFAGALPSPNRISNGVFVTSGGGGGNGGSLSLTNHGTGGLNLSAGFIVFGSAGNGNGSNLLFDAGDGTLTLPAGGFNTAPVGAGTRAGDITLRGNNISFTPGFNLFASGGSAIGDGGHITIEATSPASVLVISPADLVVSIAGGSTSGNGGALNLKSGLDILVDISGIQSFVNDGSGSSFSFIADRNVAVNGGLNASANGTGDGGSIELQSNSTDPFFIGASMANGVNGTLEANAAGNGGGGSITVRNLGTGGISTPGATIQANSVGNSGGKSGSITLEAAEYSSNFYTLIANGGTVGAGGTITVKATANALPLVFDTGFFQLVANGGTVSGKGGTVDLSSASDMLVDPSTFSLGANNGDGPSIKFTAANDITLLTFLGAPAAVNGNGGSIEINAGHNLSAASTLFASAAGSGNGGSIKVTTNSSTPFTLGSTASGNGIGSVLSANGAGPSGAGGTVEIIALGSGGIISNISVTPISVNSAGTGNGGTIILDAAKSGGSGSLILGLGSSLQQYQVNSNGGRAGTIDLSGSEISLNVGNVLLNAASPGGQGGDIFVTTTATGAGIKLAAANGFAAQIQGTDAGTLTLNAGGDILYNAPSVTQGATITAAQLTLNAGNAGPGNVTITSPSALSGLQLTGVTGATVNISFNDPSGVVSLNTITSGTYSQFPITLQGSNAALSIVNKAAGAPLNITSAGAAVVMPAGGNLNLATEGAISMSATGTFTNTAITAGGASFSYTGGTATTGLLVQDIDVSGAVSIATGTASGSSVTIAPGGSIIAGDAIAITTQNLTTNGTISGASINVTGQTNTTNINGLGHFEASTGNIVLSGGTATPTALNFNGSQTFATPDSAQLTIAADTITLGAGVALNILTDTFTLITTDNLVLNRDSRINGSGIQNAFIAISGDAPTTNIKVEDGFSATVNTASNTQGSVGFNNTATGGAVVFSGTTGSAAATLNVISHELFDTADSVVVNPSFVLSSTGTILWQASSVINNGIVSLKDSAAPVLLNNSTSTGTTTFGGTGTYITNNGNISVLAGGVLNLPTGTNLTLDSGTAPVSLQAAGFAVNNAAATLFDTGSMTSSAMSYSRSGGLVTFTTNGTTALSNSGGSLSVAAGGQTLTTIANSLTIAGGSDVTLIQEAPLLLDGITAGSLTLVSTDSVTNAGTISTTNLNVTAPSFTNNGAVNTILNTHVSSPGKLEIAGNGSWSGTRQSFTAGEQQLIFSGNQTFSGPVELNASAAGQSVVILPNITVSGNQLVDVNTPLLDLQGTLLGNPVRLNSVTGAGTIANNNGDVVLPQNLIFSGKNLAILASGNVLASSKVTKIDLSSTTASGGSLTIIAGMDFTPAPNPVAPGLSSQTFEVTGVSATGGSILLPTVALTTSTKAASKSGGTITLIANQSAANAGTVQVGAINTSATTGTGGSVNVWSPGGFMSGAINTKGGTGGAITVIDGQLIGFDPIVIDNGKLQPFSVIAFGTSDSAVDIFINGPVTTTGTTGGGGTVILQANRNVEVMGPITASGVLNLAAPNSGGDVIIDATNGSAFIKGAIDTHAGNINSTAAAGNGGMISISAQTDITVMGNIVTTGASNAGTGDGGSAGLVDLQSSTNAQNLAIGVTKVSGFISAKGGNSTGGNAGAGGAVSIDSGVVQILGSNKGVSIDATRGTGGGPLSSGVIAIDTYAVQAIPTNFDLTSAKASVVALPGGLFTVGLAKPVNGTAGTVVSGSDVANKAINGGTGRINDGSDFVQGNLSIEVTGGSQQITEGPNTVIIDSDTSGVRRLVTPAEAVALYQKTTNNNQTIILTSGTTGKTAGRADAGSLIEVDDFDVYRPFTAFKLQAVNAPTSNITLTVNGMAPALTMPKSGTIIAGTISMPEPDPGGFIGFIDFGSAPVNIPAGGAISVANTGTLILSSTSGNWTNAGLIEAGNIVLARTAAGALNFTTTGTGVTRGTAGATSPAIIVSSQYAASMNMNFKSNAAQFELPVEFADAALPTGYKALAQTNAKNATIQRPIALTFALMNLAQNPITAEVQGTAPAATAISIKTLPIKVGTVTANTPLEIGDGTSLVSNTTVLIDSASDLTFGNDVTISGGVLKSTAPTTGLLAPTDIVKPGSVTINANGTTTGITFGTDGDIIANGGNLTITSKAGGIEFGADHTFQSNGGRIVALALKPITGQAGNHFYARSTTAASNTGGGIEIGSGLITSKNLDNAFKLPKNTNPPFGSLGLNVTINNSNGVVQSLRSSGGTIDLDTSELTLNHGAIVFDALGAPNSVTFTGTSTFRTESIKPIADPQTQPTDSEFVVDTEEDGAEGLDVAQNRSASGSAFGMIP